MEIQKKQKRWQTLFLLLRGSFSLATFFRHHRCAFSDHQRLRSNYHNEMKQFMIMIKMTLINIVIIINNQHDDETNQGIFLSSSLLLSSPLLPIPELGGVGLLFHIKILFLIIVSFFRIQLDKQPLQLSSWWSWSSWSSSSSWLSWSSLTYWRLSFSGRACSGCCTCSSPGYFFSSAFLYSSP